MSALGLFAAGALSVALVMTLLWGLGIRHRNMSYVDVGWAANFALPALLYGTLGQGTAARRLLIGSMFALWSLRLALHLVRRIAGAPEEGRYAELRRRWGGAGAGALNRRFLGFFQLHAGLNLLLSLPLLIACQNRASALASPPFGYAALLMPALMLYFLLRVTGIPATESQALHSKGEAYRDYQRRTSAFVPWFPKASP